MQKQDKTFIKRNRLLSIVPLSDRTIFNMEKSGRFPRRFALSPRAVEHAHSPLPSRTPCDRSFPSVRGTPIWLTPISGFASTIMSRLAATASCPQRVLLMQFLFLPRYHERYFARCAIPVPSRHARSAALCCTGRGQSLLVAVHAVRPSTVRVTAYFAAQSTAQRGTRHHRAA